MRVFVPVEDQNLDGEIEKLVPYRQGFACLRGLREGFSLGQDGWLNFGPLSDESSARRPDARRSHPPGRR